jgi:UDP-3-O-[3-hydroxymyristoyl] N-acetylglucosamine deacetylase
MIGQRTLAKEVTLTGIGLHSGKKVSMRLIPQEAGTGIRFLRVDLPNAKPMRAYAGSVSATNNNTTLGEGEEAIHTVEHLMATLYGLGIDNLLIEINGPEVPIMDGSGASFVFICKEIGVRELNHSKKFLVVMDQIRVEHQDSWVTIEPCENFQINSTIVFPHPAISNQSINFEFSCENFIHEIARARTFGMLKDVDMLKRRGLIKGGSLDNAIVLDDYNVVNADGLRYENEFVRHKVLDTIGDVALLGFELIGKITTFKSGHYLHNQLCRKLLSNQNSYEIVGAASVKENFLNNLRLPSLISCNY